NRSFFNDANLHGGQAGLVPASGHYGADQLYDEALGGGDPNNNTYLPDLTMYPDVWDLQVLGAPAGTQMNPVNSILSSLAGPFGEDYTGNVSDNPGFVKPYKNNIFSSTVADEGGNNISVRFRPLTAGAGDYHLATACSPALDGGSLLLAP
ncbi:MAG: hypothetical protein GWN87_02225, partial [Desulfuromonadales bacterium]|nr:hypothetical protein [Desulfuromonadales bacterium]